MPYITEQERKLLDPKIKMLFKFCQGKRGRINYCCTLLTHLWALEQMKNIKSFTKKYKIVNDAYGILCSVTSEFYNAVVVPYEKLKRKENGPVSHLDATADGQEPKYKCGQCKEYFVRPKIRRKRPQHVCPNCGSAMIGELTCKHYLRS